MIIMMCGGACLCLYGTVRLAMDMKTYLPRWWQWCRLWWQKWSPWQQQAKIRRLEGYVSALEEHTSGLLDDVGVLQTQLEETQEQADGCQTELEKSKKRATALVEILKKEGREKSALQKEVEELKARDPHAMPVSAAAAVVPWVLDKVRAGDSVGEMIAGRPAPPFERIYE